MGRKRKTNNWLPVGVYADLYGYYLRAPYTRLAPLSAPQSDVLRAFENLTVTPKRSLNTLWDDFTRSQLFVRLAAKTQYEYRRSMARLLAQSTNTGTLGDTLPERVTRPTVYRYLEHRESTGALTGGKREIAALSALYTWGINTSRIRLGANPCFGVRYKEPLKQKRPYISHEQYWRLFSAAQQQCAPYVAIVMEFMRNCYLRKIEALRLQRGDIEPGIRIYCARLKGSGENFVRWNDAIGWAYQAALDLPGATSHTFLITDRHGQPYSTGAFDKAYGKLRGMPDYFTPHQIKHKACSDSADPNPAEHKDLRMAQLYKSKPREID